MKKIIVALLSVVVLSACTHSGGTQTSKKEGCSHCESEGKTDKKGCSNGSCSH